MSLIPTNRSLLQRRKSLTTTVQALLDGLIVLGTSIYSFYSAQGFISTLDAAFIVIMLGVMGLGYDQMGIYRKFGSLIGAARKLFFAWSFAFSFTIFLFFMAQYFDQFSTTTLTAVFLIGFAGQLINRWAMMTLQLHSANSEKDVNRVLLIGSGNLVEHLYRSINSNPWLHEKAIGRIRTPTKNEEISVPVLGEQSDLIDVIRSNQVKSVYIAVSLKNSDLVEQIYFELLNENVDIHWIPNIYSLNLVNHSVKEMAGLPLLTLSESPLIGNHRVIKMVIDRVFGFVALLVLSPIMIATAILIKLDSSGPIFFRQPRAGWNGKPFRIWKFRSMKVHEERKGRVTQASRHDDRITAVGRFIRKTSIDELPQLFNVMQGSMSLVGPRPHAIAHNDEYSERIRAYMARHRIKPGMTGLAQIKGYRGETKSLEKMQKRVEYDMQYINNWSVWLDFQIMLKTIPALIRDDVY